MSDDPSELAALRRVMGNYDFELFACHTDGPERLRALANAIIAAGWGPPRDEAEQTRPCGNPGVACDYDLGRQDMEAERDALRAQVARVEVVARQWDSTPDYQPNDYDRGRVDQRHDMSMQLHAALEPRA